MRVLGLAECKEIFSRPLRTTRLKTDRSAYENLDIFFGFLDFTKKALTGGPEYDIP